MLMLDRRHMGFTCHSCLKHSDDNSFSCNWCFKHLRPLHDSLQLYMGMSPSVVLVLRYPDFRLTSDSQSQYIWPTTIGTVMITVDAATNQTAATTIYHSVSMNTFQKSSREPG